MRVFNDGSLADASEMFASAIDTRTVLDNLTEKLDRIHRTVDRLVALSLDIPD